MGRSSLLGAEYADAEPRGRDTATLGPGNSSDSGSDMAGLADSETGDPGLPVDMAMRDDVPHPLMDNDLQGGGSSDAGGTGERRSAAGDAGLREAADIGVDRIFTPAEDGDDAAADDADPGAGRAQDEDRDLAFMDQATAPDPADDDEDEDDDEGGDDEEADSGAVAFDPAPQAAARARRASAAAAAAAAAAAVTPAARTARVHASQAHRSQGDAPPTPPTPDRPNPEPDGPDDDGTHPAPGDVEEDEDRHPGRT